MNSSRLALFAIAALVAAHLLPPSSPTPPSPQNEMTPASSSSSACYPRGPKPSELRFLRKHNRARVRRGVPRLSLDRQLSKVAIVHTREMVNAGVIYHVASSLLSRRVTNWSTLGENVGVGDNVDQLHRAFMNSPGHRANILYSGFRYIGIGVTRAHDRMWVTVNFEARRDPGSPLC